jgi:hypothetical protein
MCRVALALSAAVVLLANTEAFAQDRLAPIPRVVLDLHGIIPVFPNDNAQLAASRTVSTDPPRPLSVGELPGPGLGARVGVHVYVFKWKAITLGLGGEVFSARSAGTPPEGSDGLVPVTERLTSADVQLRIRARMELHQRRARAFPMGDSPGRTISDVRRHRHAADDELRRRRALVD